MKKLIAILFVAVVTGVFLVGCSSVAAYSIQMSDGRVVQVIQINFENPTSQTYLDMGKIKQKIEEILYITPGRKEIRYKEDGQERLIQFNYGKTHTVQHSENHLRLQITFNNLASYIYFNEYDLNYVRFIRIDQTAIVPSTDVSVNWGLFFVERRVTMPNPFRLFFEGEGTRAGKVLNFLKAEFPEEEPYLVYMMLFSTRRTDTNAYDSRRTPDLFGWEHVFITQAGEAPEDIVIFDRFANPPIWYAIGIVATMIFMLVLYLLVRKKVRS